MAFIWLCGLLSSCGNPDLPSSAAGDPMSDDISRGGTAMNTTVVSSVTEETTLTRQDGETSTESSTNTTSAVTTAPSVSEDTFPACLDRAGKDLELSLIKAQRRSFSVKNALASENRGDAVRVANVIRKACNGEKIKVGVLGDSIGQGAGASPVGQSFANRVFDWWTAVFGSDRVELVNASIGSNTLTNIVHRMDSDLLSKNPDIVFVSAWDCHASEDNFAIESILKRLLDKGIAVVLVQVTASNGMNRYSLFADVARHYKVPLISYANAYEKSDYTWKDVGADSIHPSNTGHALIALCVNSFLQETAQALDSIGTTPATLPNAPLRTQGWRYVNATIWDRNNSGKFTIIQKGSFADFDRKMTSFRTYNGWKSSVTGDVLECKLSSIKTLHLMCNYVSGGGGKASVTVTGDDGTKYIENFTVNTDPENNQDYSWNTALLAKNVNQPVTVQIKVTGGTFILLGFMVTV